MTGCLLSPFDTSNMKVHVCERCQKVLDTFFEHRSKIIIESPRIASPVLFTDIDLYFKSFYFSICLLKSRME